VASETGPYDAQDGAGEQDGAGHVRADEGRGEDRGHGVKGWGGGMGQRGEEGDERSGESREHEGGEAECPDAGTGLAAVGCHPPRPTPLPRGRRAARISVVDRGTTAASCRPLRPMTGADLMRVADGHRTQDGERGRRTRRSQPDDTRGA